MMIQLPLSELRLLGIRAYTPIISHIAAVVDRRTGHRALSFHFELPFSHLNQTQIVLAFSHSALVTMADSTCSCALLLLLCASHCSDPYLTWSW